MLLPATRQQFDQAVHPRLRALGRRLRLYVLLDGLSVISAVGLACILITLSVDRLFHLDRDMRLVQLVVLLAVIASVAWWRVYRPLRVTVNCHHLAILVERRYPGLHSRLITAVEFADPASAWPATSGVHSPAMVDAVVRQAVAEVHDLRLDEVLAHPRARRRALLTLGCVAVVVLMALVSRETMALWFQRNLLLRNLNWPRRNRLIVEGLVDGRIVVPRGEDVTVSAVVAEGFEPPRQVYIVYTGSSGARGREQMPAVSGAAVRFTHTLEGLTAPLQCQIIGGDARTEPFAIDVVDRPQISAVVMRITPPAYTHMEGYDLRPGQTVAEVLRGSGIRFVIRTNKPVVQARLMRQIQGQEETITQAQRIRDCELVADDVPPASATYYFHMLDESGLSNLSERVPPVRMSVRLVADKPPRVKMKVKGAGDMITTDALLPIEADFADSYGLATADLVVSLGRDNTAPTAEPLPGFEPGTKTFAQAMNWSAATHQLRPGDRLALHAEARDFDDVAGPNVGKSVPLSFRVVSREELLAELSRREQEHRQDFERLLRQQEELFANLLSVSGGASRPVPGPVNPPKEQPNHSQQLAPLARRQRDYAGRLNLIRLQFEQVLAELRVNQLSSPPVEARLGGGVVEPMSSLSQSRMPEAADDLDRLARQDTVETQQQARAAQQAIVTEMNRILANLVKWEGFQEAVTLLREVLKMQSAVNQETEKRVETDVFGPRPAEKK